MKQRETCWKQFPFRSMDRLAAQEFLNQMAGQGWELERIESFGFARFRRSERADLAYCLDWTAPSLPESEGYLRLLSDAGWEPVLKWGSLNVYASRPGTRPAPIQTDPEIEYERFRKKAGGQLWALIFALCLSLVPLGLWCVAPDAFLSLLVYSNVSFFVLLTAPLAFLGLLAAVVQTARWQLAWKRSPDASPPRPARRWEWLSLAALGYLLLCLAAFLADAWLNAVDPIHMVACFLVYTFLFIVHLAAHRKDRNFSLGRVGITLFFVLALVGTLLHGGVRERFPGRAPSLPMIPGETYTEQLRSDTPLGSSLWWWEDGQHCMLSLWTSPRLAQRHAEAALGRDSWSPVPGQEDVWYHQEEQGFLHQYLIWRGDCLLELRCAQGLEPQSFPLILDWLKGVD